MYKMTFIIAVVIISVNTALALPGSGTQQDPWQIESLADFNEFAADPNYWDDYTRLETDVNLAGQTYTTAVIAPDTDNSNWWFDGTAFTGVFDGHGHKITGLTIDGAGNDYLGLFGYNRGKVRNLGLEGGCVSGHCQIGGLVGWSEHGSVSNCYSTGSVSGDSGVGGMVGSNTRGGDVSKNCYFTGDVNGVDDVGGLVGFNEGSVSNCYSTGDVIGDNYVGGLVGGNGLYGSGSVSNCYSTSDVSGNYDVGGLVGWNDSSVSNCFWDTDTQTHGVTDSIGYNRGTVINVAGLPTAQMQTGSTFIDAGWDFLAIWLINNAATYPILRQEIRCDLNGDGVINLLDFAIFAGHWLEGAAS